MLAEPVCSIASVVENNGNSFDGGILLTWRNFDAVRRLEKGSGFARSIRGFGND